MHETIKLPDAVRLCYAEIHPPRLQSNSNPPTGMAKLLRNRRLGIGLIAIIGLILAVNFGHRPAESQVPKSQASAKQAPSTGEFAKRIQPLFKKYCIRCHNADKKTSGIRVDHLDGKLPERQLVLWNDVLKQIKSGAMPPEDEKQPTDAERKFLAEWIAKAIIAAKSRDPEKNGSVRRLTVAQYRNTLRDLLGIDDNLTAILPADAVSKDGFLNNGKTLSLSPLLIEAYFEIAEQALDRCIVDEKTKPVIQSFRVDLGRAINKKPCPDKLILGANSLLLDNRDFVVTQPKPTKSFAFTPFAMQTKYRFIEGYRGNATVRGWRDFDSIYHNVFACMRGTRGYPKGEAYETVPSGLLLRPAIPSAELFKQSSTYGPNANFKISLRQLPDFGRFRVRVTAAKYDDALLLNRDDKPQPKSNDAITITGPKAEQAITIAKAGIYQVDVYPVGKPKRGKKRRRNRPALSLKLNDRLFTARMSQPAFLVARLQTGKLKVVIEGGNRDIERIVFTPLSASSTIAKRFLTFEKRSPRVGVHLGFRRDCGSTYAPVEQPVAVTSTKSKTFVFDGTITNYPSPDVEKNNVNYLAGIREIAVRSEYTDGRDRPRLRLRSVEFEGPYYDTWPPAPHRRILFASKNKANKAKYAEEIIRRFATKAYRRPVTKAEAATLLAVWRASFKKTGDFQQSIKDALLVVLTSPQFLFITESSATPKAEPIAPYELASKLSYFLWNTAPDAKLRKRAAAKSLRKSLDTQVNRMVADERFRQFTDEFVSQWLNLDKFDVVQTDRKRYPTLTRDTKSELRKEPVRFVEYLIRNNLSIENLIRSDFVMANEVVAAYYGLGDKTESGFRFVPIRHNKKHLGGVLSQPAVLAGLSDGRESNPVKRGAWFARKIIADPPDDPPPNVPALPEENVKKLTLRQRLAQHRNQRGCAKCHEGIDPWGVPFQEFDAGGLFKKEKVDARSTLPDKEEVVGFHGLREYLITKRIDRVAYSYLYHLASYAVGRRLTYNEREYLMTAARRFKPNGYKMRDMLRFVVRSPIFLEK